MPALSSRFRHVAIWLLALGVLACMSWPAIHAGLGELFVVRVAVEVPKKGVGPI